MGSAGPYNAETLFNEKVCTAGSHRPHVRADGSVQEGHRFEES